jgi:cysteine sulfinate desulfinase/cysteine desulfurase-like protein
MGHGVERARGSVRFSLGVGTSTETIRIVLAALEELVPARRARATSARGGVAR